METRVEAPLTVAVAVNGSKNSKYALKWALEKFIPQGIIFFRLVYVRPKITLIPTPMGNYLPISKVRDDVASAYRKDVETQTNSMLQPYKNMCNQRKVEAEAVVIEADDVVESVSAEINRYTVSKLVIGASSRNIFTRKFKGGKLSSKFSECIPTFCALYVVSKGKLSCVHASTDRIAHECTSTNVSCSSLSHTSSGRSEWVNSEMGKSSLASSSSLQSQRNQDPKVIDQDFVDMIQCPDDKFHTEIVSFPTNEDFTSSSSNTLIQCINSTASSCKSSQTDRLSWNYDQASTSDIANKSSLPQNEVTVDFELERLRIELRHLQGMYEVAHDEFFDASRQLTVLSARHEEETSRLNEIRIREEKAREIARIERERREATEKEAEYVRECAEKEALYRKDAEDGAAYEASEKRRLESHLACSHEQYKKYSWEDIESATSLFSDARKIGSGANGKVYKASFHHTIAAVKILHSNEGRETQQFKQELEILGRIRHPHVLLLLGACPDHSCLVYEYMENGSLEDRLQCKNNTPPLPWHYRYRIAWEIASALVFLHNSKPSPIIHRDLKPANILIDNNFVSKIGDVGLSTLLPALDYTKATMYKDTAPVGTFFYMDPEYQRTGLLSPKSDTYALGMVILQLLTGKPPMGLAYIVETAMEEDLLVDVLDYGAGQWPNEETRQLALLGLSCMEMRRKDRPELKDMVLPVLERLKDFADNAQDLAAPGHFICPILKEVMEDPCVASDGYTYERRAIERWLSMNDKSPCTNTKMPDKNLITNRLLPSEINDWRGRRK